MRHVHLYHSRMSSDDAVLLLSDEEGNGRSDSWSSLAITIFILYGTCKYILGLLVWRYICGVCKCMCVCGCVCVCVCVCVCEG